MNIQVIIPVEYQVGAAVEMSNFGFTHGTGTVTSSSCEQSTIDYTVSTTADSDTGRIFALAERIFGVTREALSSKDRSRHLVDARMSIMRALVCYEMMNYTDVGKIFNKNRVTVNYMVNRWDAVQYYDSKTREKLYEFDKQARIILTGY